MQSSRVEHDVKIKMNHDHMEYENDEEHLKRDSIEQERGIEKSMKDIRIMRFSTEREAMKYLMGHE